MEQKKVNTLQCGNPARFCLAFAEAAPPLWVSLERVDKGELGGLVLWGAFLSELGVCGRVPSFVCESLGLNLLVLLL